MQYSCVASLVLKDFMVPDFKTIFFFYLTKCSSVLWGWILPHLRQECSIVLESNAVIKKIYTCEDYEHFGEVKA